MSNERDWQVTGLIRERLCLGAREAESIPGDSCMRASCLEVAEELERPSCFGGWVIVGEFTSLRYLTYGTHPFCEKTFFALGRESGRAKIV